jgi:hypothetical protein
MNRQAFVFALLLGSLGFTRSAAAQCSNATINAGLAAAFGSANVASYTARIKTGQPYAAQICDVNRYAGGAFTTANIANYAKASLVCQDPWIAQAFLDLGQQLNGHSPVQTESTLFSTLGDCNTSNYGSWGSYAALRVNVQNHFAPNMANSPGMAQITGPASFSASATPTVTWALTTSPTGTLCASGIRMLVNGTTAVPFSGVVPITAQQAPLAMRFTSAGAITLTLWDNCTGKQVSNVFTATITAPSVTSLVTMTAPTTASAVAAMVGLNASGAIVNGAGAAISGGGFYFLSGSGSSIVASGAGNYQVSLAGRSFTVTASSSPNGILVDNSGNPVRIVASGAGNFQLQAGGSIVASGAGNIILNGGGNIVASGAGNIILNGGGNIVASGAGNFQVVSNPLSAVSAVGLAAIFGAGVISNDGGSFTNQAAMAARLPNLVNISQAVTSPQIIAAGTTGIPTAVGNTGYQLQSAGPFRLTAFGVDSPSWIVNSTHRISWTGTGTASASETVSIWLQTSAGMVRLASGIPAAQGAYNLPINTVRSGTTGTLILLDDVSKQQLSGSAIRVN